MTQKGIARSGDIELHWQTSGQNGSADTVLLINGLGGCSKRWGDRYPALLGERFRVVRFDNRGTGASSKPSDAFTLEDMAVDATAVLDAVGVERAHVVGVSMGGMISQLVALEHAKRVNKLILMSTHHGGPNIHQPTEAAQAVFMPPAGLGVEEVTRQAMTAFVAPGFADRQPEVIDRLVEIAVESPTPYGAFMAQLQAILASDRTERLKDVDRDTLVVHGDEDPLVPIGNGRQIHERIPGSKLHVLNGCGHLPMWEMPEALAKTTLEFLG